MRQYSSLASVVRGLLPIAVSAVCATGLSPRERLVSLPAPLLPESFAAAMLARYASLRAMRQVLVAAVSSIRPAGALPDPMLSVSAAPRTFGSATGTGEDIEVSQALPWWGTPEARKEIARGMRRWRVAPSRRCGLSAGVFADRMFVHCALGINSGNPSAEIAGGFVKRRDTQGADV